MNFLLFLFALLVLECDTWIPVMVVLSSMLDFQGKQALSEHINSVRSKCIPKIVYTYVSYQYYNWIYVVDLILFQFLLLVLEGDTYIIATAALTSVLHVQRKQALSEHIHPVGS